MKAKIIFILLIGWGTVFSQVPYNELPDWESTPAGRISTGLALADINGDGFKDMIVADGNDTMKILLRYVYSILKEGSF